MPAESIDRRVDMCYVQLKVADIGRALDLCCGALGFELQQREEWRRSSPRAVTTITSA